MKLLAAITFFATQLAWAEVPSFIVKIVQQPVGVEYQAEPPAKHHFNIKAPMNFKQTDAIAADELVVKPAEAKPEKITFKVEQEFSTANITLYLCDDANTYCVKKVAEVKAPNATKWEKAPARTKEPEKKTEEKAGKPLHGFIDNEPDKAFAQAKAEKKLLLIDFYGIWCPPCNMFSEQVFPRKDFAEKTKNFVKLGLDADSEKSWPLKSRYKVKGYPTIILANSEGEELRRIVGFEPADLFYKDLSSALKLSSLGGTKGLSTKANLGDLDSQTQLARYHLEREEYKEALEWVTLARASNPNDRTARVLWSRIKVESAAEGTKKQVLEEVIPVCEDQVECLNYRSELAELSDDANKKKHLEALVSGASKAILDPKKIAGTEYTKTDVLAMKAGAQEELGKKDDAVETWKQVVKAIKSLPKSSTERGSSLELAYALYKTGDVAAARTLYESFEKKYPEEFTFYFAHAKLESRLKNQERAEELGKLALKYSYGDNRLRAVEFLAKTLREQGKTKEALALVDDTLGAAKRPEDPSIRTTRYLKALQALKSEPAK